MKSIVLADVPISSTPLGTGDLAHLYPSFSTIINLLIKNSFVIAGIILLFLLIYGGFMFIIGAGDGDAKKAAQAQSAITSALIGFVIVFAAYFIIQIIEVITGTQILNSGF